MLIQLLIEWNEKHSKEEKKKGKKYPTHLHTQERYTYTHNKKNWFCWIFNFLRLFSLKIIYIFTFPFHFALAQGEGKKG